MSGDRPAATGARIVVLASLGGGLEFYDFIAYGIFASAIAPTFFPSDHSSAALLRTFLVFAIGYLIRPLGGIGFSHFGDRFGRRRTFLVSLLGISLATIGMALCPSHASWGNWGTILFVALRLLQGLCLGGELPGSITYLAEVVKPGRTGLACGVLFGCASLGVVLAGGINVVLHAVLPPAAMAAYGWRIAFGIGGLLGIVSYLPRRLLAESPVFTRMRERQEVERLPLLLVLRKGFGPVAAGVGATAVVAGFNGILFGYLPIYLIRISGYPSGSVASALFAGLVTGVPAVVIGGALSDVLEARLVLRMGAGVVLLAGLLFFNAVSAHGTTHLAYWLAGFGAAGGLAGGAFGAVLVDLFETRIRFSGVALSYNIGFAIFSGLAPLMAAGLIAATGSVAAPALYLAGVALVAVIASFSARTVFSRSRQAMA